jgi:hypothetical protein
MSTAELEINTWVQTENTVAAAETWDHFAEEELEPPQAREPQPALPDDFWQEWFGLWL